MSEETDTWKRGKMHKSEGKVEVYSKILKLIRESKINFIGVIEIYCSHGIKVETEIVKNMINEQENRKKQIEKEG